jgi:hypothetical protein
LYSCNIIADTVKIIVNYLPQYQEHFRSLKQNRNKITGYARKSKGKDDETRVNFLKFMCRRLEERSSIDIFLVSICSNADNPILHKDINGNKKLLQKLVVDGDMQGKSVNI